MSKRNSKGLQQKLASKQGRNFKEDKSQTNIPLSRLIASERDDSSSNLSRDSPEDEPLPNFNDDSALSI